MTKITAGNINVYLGFSDEVLPTLPGPPEGSLYIFLDKPQIWIARGLVWAFLMPLNLSLSVPYGSNIDESVSIPQPDGGTTYRQVVALGSPIAGQVISPIEAGIEKLLQFQSLILTELRINNLLTQGIGTVPVLDDLDQLRAYYALTTEETITR